MTVNETIVTGRYFRKLIDAATRQWQRFSFWTKASDVEFDDGKNAQDKLGMINGITDDTNTERSDLALSAKAGKNICGQVTKIVNQTLSGLTIKPCTMDQYNTSSKDSNTLYIIIE